MRCLSSPLIQISNFYGFMCCDCAVGYIYTPDEILYRNVNNHICVNDDDDTDEQTSVNTNFTYKEQKKVGIICHDDTIVSSTLVGLSTQSPRNNEDELGLSETMVDPDLAYYRHFDTVLHRRANCSPLAITSLEEDRQVLLSSNGDITDRDEEKRIKRSLTRYQYNICATTDVEQKKTLVQEYEQYKSKFDVDNTEDAEQAQLYLENARNKGANVNRDDQRIVFYQKAIAFTNNMEAKNELKVEYRRFCFGLKK